MYGRMAGFAGLISPRPVPGVVYSAGLYRTTYTGYFADVPSFFATATATATLVQTTVIEEPATDDGSSFSMQWLGYFLPTTTETYTFFLNSDDASYLWIGSNALSGFSTANATINNGGAHGPVEVSGTAALTSGVYYPIQIQFGEQGVLDLGKDVKKILSDGKIGRVGTTR